MGEIIECPVDGCDYSGPHKSVLGHYSGKSDGLHPGGYQKAKSLLESDSPPEPEPESKPEQQPEQEPTNTAESTSNSNPTFGSAEPQPEPEPQSEPSDQPQQTDQSSGEPRCLDCEGELVDFTDVERGTYAEIANGEIHVKGEYLCSECGQWWFDK
jgi:hypothetical protein